MPPIICCPRPAVRFGRLACAVLANIPGRRLVAGFGAGLAAAALAVSGVSDVQAQSAPGQAPVASDPIRVVATFSILGDMVREVGGERVALETIVGPDGDAHAFEPAPRDARALGAAQLLVRNGLGFEGWLPRLREVSGFKGLDIVASDGVPVRVLSDAPAATGHHGHDHEGAHDAGAHGHTDGYEQSDTHGHHHAGDADPHAWQDLSNGVIYVRNIAQGLAAIDPAHAAEYHRRAEAYVLRLQAADRAWRDDLASIAPARRVMMTTHDAFGYLGRAYDIRIISVLGLSSEAEPAAGALARIIDQIREQDIRAVFLEKAVNPTLIRRIAQETGVEVGGTLYADTLGAPGTPAGTYLGMFHWNTRQILAALQD